MCANALGYYHINRAQSIYYEGNDLRMKILFSSADNCHVFLNILHETMHRLYTRPCRGDAEVTFNHNYERIRLQDLPEAILPGHYDSNEYDSPALTDHISDDSASVVSLSNPTAHLLMIEDPDREYMVGLNVYDCHLMSVSKYPKEKNNPNNILRMSWNLHQHFDGLNMQGNHLVPSIAIGFVCADKQEDVQVSHDYTELKYRVTVSVESPDKRILKAVGGMLKAGSKPNPDESGKLYSFVYVDSAEDFERCLTVKYNETQALWQSHQTGDPLPVVEAENQKRR